MEGMLGEVVVVGLGPGGRDGLTFGAWDAIRDADPLLLRTASHPIADWLKEQEVVFEAYDHVYEAYGQFHEVYERIAADVVERAARGGRKVTYAVPGHPSVAETTVALIRERCAAQGIRCRLISSESFLDRAFASLGFDPADGFQLVDATSFYPERLNAHHHIIVTQVYDRFTASEVKLGLMTRYPDDYEIVIAHALGVDGEEAVERVPLYELDRAQGYGNLSLVYVPPTAQENVHFRTFEKLREIIAILRSPEGCPWDREQTHRSLRKYMIEEAFEAVEAIDEDDMDQLRDELGDVLLQVLLHARIAEESGSFDIADVIASLSAKMVRRHPHVFGDAEADSVDDVMATWQEVKAKEREGEDRQAASVLDGVPSGLPGLMKAAALQKKAAKAGFDWDRPDDIIDKVNEELGEFREALEIGGEDPARADRLLDEMGDLLFAVVNLARFLRIDPEEALAGTNRKFMQRFRYIEEQLRLRGKSFDQTDINEMERYWQEAKRS